MREASKSPSGSAGGKATPVGVADLFDPAGVLAAEILREALPKSVWTSLERNEPKIFLLDVPGASWWKPVTAGLKQLFDRPLVVTPSTSTSRTRERGDTVVDTPLFAILGDASAMSAELVAGTDVAVVVKPTARALSRALKRLYGKRAIVRRSDFAGLDWPELLIALRPGSSGRECVARWRRIAAALSAPIAADRTPTLETLAGYGEAMAKVRAIAADILRVRDGRLAGDQLPSILLYGPPGTGKTLLARSIGKTVGLPFIQTSVGDWFSGDRAHLGTVIGEIRRFFEAVAAAAPCVALIDEIDGLPDRARLDDRDREWWTPIVTLVLISIDRLRAKGSGVVLIGATNHYRRLDAALVRPGRFDVHIEIKGPTTEADYLSIFRQHLAGDLAGEDLSLVARAALAQRVTGAVIEAWVKAAGQRARAANRKPELDDLVQEATPPTTRSAEQELRVALHEAAHAVTGRVLGLTVTSVTLVKAKGAEGRASFLEDSAPVTLGELEENIVTGLAGRAADELISGAAEAGAIGDLHQATGLLAAVHAAYGLRGRLTSAGSIDNALVVMRGDPKLQQKVEADLQRLMSRARQLVGSHRRAIEILAGTLVKNRIAMQADVDAAILADPAGRTAAIWRKIVKRTAGEDGEGPANDLGPRAPESGR